MKKVFLLLTVLTIMSCAEQEITEQEVVDPTLSTQDQRNNCTGFGVFDNVEYDCGWKRGYEDWVYHYNITVDQLDYDPCYRVSIVGTSGSYLLYAGQTGATSHIIQVTQNNNQSYYNDLFNDLSTDYLRGKADGYQWGRGQEPLAYNNGSPKCFGEEDFGGNPF